PDHPRQTTQEGTQADIDAAVAHLRPRSRAAFTVGFCFGGRNSWLAAASDHGLTGAVGFYGMSGDRGAVLKGAIDRAPEMTAPILALSGRAAQNITAVLDEPFHRALSLPAAW